MYCIYLGRSSTKMNRAIVYSVISMAVAAIIIFALLGNGSFNRVIIKGDETKQTTTATTTPALQPLSR